MSRSITLQLDCNENFVGEISRTKKAPCSKVSLPSLVSFFLAPGKLFGLLSDCSSSQRHNGRFYLIFLSFYSISLLSHITLFCILIITVCYIIPTIYPCSGATIRIGKREKYFLVWRVKTVFLFLKCN